jgi:hypothetical protein
MKPYLERTILVDSAEIEDTFNASVDPATDLQRFATKTMVESQVHLLYRLKEAHLLKEVVDA